MPLTRGRIIGYDADRMMFEFTMINARDARVVTCHISSVAMDDLDGKRGTRRSEREAQFIRFRDAIEQIASDLFKGDSAVEDAVVRIFAKHLPQERKTS
jgi:hypothetical protein